MLAPFRRHALRAAAAAAAAADPIMAAELGTQTRRDRFTFAELFSGIGGFRIGLEAIGGRCVFACEYCKFAQATYRQNWPDDPSGLVVGDVRRQSTPSIPSADVLVAGFPCQSFSNAGRVRRFDDDRGQLFYELVRLATACRFRALLLENVRGLLEPEVMAEVVGALSAAGYHVQTREFDAALLLPQRRRRVFLACFRDAAAARIFAWPALPALRRCAYDALQPAEQLPAGLALPPAKWERVSGSSYFGRYPGARLLPPGALAQTLQTTYLSGYLLYSQFVPSRRGACGCTEEAGGAASAPPPRFFSPRECARLMGFPETFALPGQPGLTYRQLGNAVCPPLVAALGACVVHALEASLVSPTLPSEGEAEEAAGRGGAHEAVWVALQLALAAAPPEQRPTHAWLPPALVRTLGLDASAQAGAEPGGESLPSGPVTACARGAAFHASPEDGWARWSIDELLRHAAASAGEGACQLPRRDPVAPVQTLPSPTREAKAEAAALMRTAERVWMLRGSV